MSFQPMYSIPGFAEPFSSISHLLAAGVYFFLGIWMISRHWGSPRHVYSILVFTISSVFLLSMSGVYHLLDIGGFPREVMQRLDHAGVFVLIAGTFTPVHGILFSRWWRWGMLFLIWGLAITSITIKTIYFNEIEEWVGLLLFLGLGWVGAISGLLIYRLLGLTFIKPLLYGALAYTVGAIMEYFRTPELIPGIIGPHELFHIAVLFGLGYHTVFVYHCAEYSRAEENGDNSKYSIRSRN